MHGRVEPNEGEIVLPMKRSIFEREKWHVHYEGKKAISNWQVIEYFDWPTENVRWKNCLSLLKVGLKTGRTHQIRVHFSFLGWPLFGDDKYLQKQQSAADRDLLKRHFLHANKIAFEEMDGQKVEIVSGLPDECEELLAKIKSG